MEPACPAAGWIFLDEIRSDSTTIVMNSDRTPEAELLAANEGEGTRLLLGTEPVPEEVGGDDDDVGGQTRQHAHAVA